MMQFELLTPAHGLASFQVEAVQLPGAEGDMTAMPGHVPMVILLRPGVVQARMEHETRDFVVMRGFAEIAGQSVAVLAERACESTDSARAEVAEALNTARAAMENAGGNTGENAADRDRAAKYLADLEQLAQTLEVR